MAMVRTYSEGELLGRDGGITESLPLKDTTLTERGDFLALDLGGTNFRVLLVHVGDGGVRIINQIYQVPEHVAQGSGQQVPPSLGPDVKRVGGGRAGLSPP